MTLHFLHELDNDCENDDLQNCHGKLESFQKALTGGAGVTAFFALNKIEFHFKNSKALRTFNAEKIENLLPKLRVCLTWKIKKKNAIDLCFLSKNFYTKSSMEINRNCEMNEKQILKIGIYCKKENGC